MKRRVILHAFGKGGYGRNCEPFFLSSRGVGRIFGKRCKNCERNKTRSSAKGLDPEKGCPRIWKIRTTTFTSRQFLRFSCFKFVFPSKLPSRLEFSNFIGRIASLCDFSLAFRFHYSDIYKFRARISFQGTARALHAWEKPKAVPEEFDNFGKL